MIRLTLLCALPWLLAGQSSVEKQKLSVRKQMQTGAVTASFFTVAWLDGPPAPANQPAPADCDPLDKGLLQDIVIEHAAKEKLDPKLVQALIARESGGRPCAVSVKGAQGLMQLMPGTQNDLGVSDPFDPTENVRGGTKYLRQMMTRYKDDVKLALAAYNAGPQRVEDKIPEIPETQAYVAAIMSALGTK